MLCLRKELGLESFKLAKKSQNIVYMPFKVKRLRSPCLNFAIFMKNCIIWCYMMTKPAVVMSAFLLHMIWAYKGFFILILGTTIVVCVKLVQLKKWVKKKLFLMDTQIAQNCGFS